MIGRFRKLSIGVHIVLTIKTMNRQTKQYFFNILMTYEDPAHGGKIGEYQNGQLA